MASAIGQTFDSRAVSDVPTSSQFSPWYRSIMKNCIGKELTKIPMPVNFNEPLSTLQRLAEDFEYSSLLDKVSVESFSFYLNSCESDSGSETRIIEFYY